MNKKSVDALRNIADEAIKPKTQLSRKARSTLSPPKEGAADKTRKRPRKHGAVRPDDMATAQLAAAALQEESTQAQVESAQTPENNAIVQFVIEKAEVPEVPESQVAQSTHDAETAVKDKEETVADEEVEEPVEPGMSEEELHELVHQIGPALSPSRRNKKIGVVLRGLVLHGPAVKKAILAELESHLGVASNPMRKLLAQYENEAFVAKIIHATPDKEEQALAVAEGLTERYVIWSINLLTGGLNKASFAVWYEEEWHLLSPQEMIVTMGLANLKAKPAKEILYFISTMAPVQGPPASGEVGFCVGLLNGRFDFATGQLHGACPEGKLLNRLGRRYLLPHERVPAIENNFYRMLDVYAPGVSRMVKQSLLPRIIAPWPGGKHIYLVGTPGTGKSVLIAMCRCLVDSQVSSIVGKRKSDSHATTRLDNAFFNFTSEAKRVPIKNLERWKDEADREIFEVNPKGKSGYMARYMCTSIAAANLLPPLPVFGSEMWRRILVIPFLRRIMGVAGLGDDKISILISKLTEEELDSVWSDAADIAAKCGPNGVYPGDPSDKETESMYAELTEPLRIFMQGMIKWNDAGGKLLVSEILERYRSSEYAVIDQAAGLKDERKDRVLQELVLQIGVSMGGIPSRQRTESCHKGRQALAGLSWGNSTVIASDTLNDFMIIPEDLDEYQEPASPAPAEVQ